MNLTKREWVIVVVDDNGVDAVFGPYPTRQRAALAWQNTIKATRHRTALASYRQVTPPAPESCPVCDGEGGPGPLDPCPECNRYGGLT